MIAFTILGEPASKANQRRIVKFGARSALVKSKKACSYEESALRQIPAKMRLRLEMPVAITIRIFYASERPDLDESVILDCLQDRYKTFAGKRMLIQSGCYRNDRQVREKHIYHAIDKRNPRAEIDIRPIE